MPIRFATFSLLALFLAGCADEQPDQRLVQNEHLAAKRDQQPTEDTRRQRTLGQGESDRIYNQGGLR